MRSPPHHPAQNEREAALPSLLVAVLDEIYTAKTENRGVKSGTAKRGGLTP